MRCPLAGAPRIWRHVPGYDSDDEESEDGKAMERDTDQDPRRLALIQASLADRLLEAPLVRFAPVRLPKASSKDCRDPGKDTSANKPFGLSAAEKFKRRNTGTFVFSSLAWRAGSGGQAPTFRLEHASAPIVRETCVANGLQQINDQDFCLLWSGPGLRDNGFRDLHEFQRVNHFPGSTELTRKDSMFENLSGMVEEFGEENIDFIPETFVLPEQADAFLDAYRQTGGLWIAKPSNSACGQGIMIFRNLATTRLMLTDSAVVSRYVENPLLIQGLKFDLRVYVVVTQYEPLRAYIYREGLARFASAPYRTDDASLSDNYRQLTNYSINKSAPNFCENADLAQDNCGHKWSLSALNKHLTCIGADVTLMWTRIMDLIVKTLFAVEPCIGQKTKKTVLFNGVCFEVYGFDVLVDDCLKPWILEVNLSPSMQAESPLDWHVKSSLLSDAFNLVGVCNPDYKTVRTSRACAQIHQARIAHRKLVQERGSFTGIDAKEKSGGRSRRRHSKGGRPAVSPKPLVLDTLGEAQLKLLARSFQEFQRANNFIRLYPTRVTVERYAPIVCARSKGWRMSASQLLASALYGPEPVGSEAGLRGEAEPQSPPSPPPSAQTPALPRAGGRVRALPPRPAGVSQDTAASPSWPSRPPRVGGRGARPAAVARRGGGAGAAGNGDAAGDAKDDDAGGSERSLEESDEEDFTPPATAATSDGGPRSGGRPPSPGAAARPASAGDFAVDAEPSRRGAAVADDSPEDEDRDRAGGQSDDEADWSERASSPPSASCGEKEDGAHGDEPVEEGMAAEPVREAPSVDSDDAVAEEVVDKASAGSACSTSTPRTPAESAGERVADRARALRALQLLGARDCWRLILMEYLVRVAHACSALSVRERALLVQCASYARLSMFSRRARQLLDAWRAQSPAADSDADDSDLDSGGLVDEIVAVCRALLLSLASEPWVAMPGIPPPSSPKSAASWQRLRLGQTVRDVARHLPPELMTSPGPIKQAVENLPALSSEELESLLLSPRFAEDFGLLPELFATGQLEPPGRGGRGGAAVGGGGGGGARPGATRVQHFYSPLCEVAQAQHLLRSGDRLDDTGDGAAKAGGAGGPPRLPMLPVRSLLYFPEIEAADSPQRAPSARQQAAKVSRRWLPSSPALEKAQRRIRRRYTTSFGAVGPLASAEAAVASGPEASATPRTPGGLGVEGTLRPRTPGLGVDGGLRRTTSSGALCAPGGLRVARPPSRVARPLG